MAAPRPHILFVLADDLGWAEVGWNGAPPELFPSERRTLTPRLDELAQEGTVLHRHYMHMFCSPSRSAIQSGRSPTQVNVLNPRNHGSSDGVPCDMTGLGEVMVKGGYATHCTLQPALTPSKRLRTRNC